MPAHLHPLRPGGVQALNRFVPRVGHPVQVASDRAGRGVDPVGVPCPLPALRSAVVAQDPADEVAVRVARQKVVMAVGEGARPDEAGHAGTGRASRIAVRIIVDDKAS